MDAKNWAAFEASIEVLRARKRSGWKMTSLQERLIEKNNKPRPRPKARDHRTVLVAFKCSRCASFVRERISRDYLEDFRQAVMNQTVKCGCEE